MAIMTIIGRIMREIRSRVELRYRRAHFIFSCRLQGVNLKIGRNVCFWHPVRVWAAAPGQIVLGDNVAFGVSGMFGAAPWRGAIGIQLRAPGAELCIKRDCIVMPETEFIVFERIELGARTTLGIQCKLIDSDVHDFHPDRFGELGRSAPIRIGSQVWVCPEVTILKGVTVGDSTVIGNKSVLQRSLPSRCVATGNPARIFIQYPPIQGVGAHASGTMITH